MTLNNTDAPEKPEVIKDVYDRLLPGYEELSRLDQTATEPIMWVFNDLTREYERVLLFLRKAANQYNAFERLANSTQGEANEPNEA